MIPGPSREPDADSSRAPTGRSFSFAGTGLSLNRFAAIDFYRWCGVAGPAESECAALRSLRSKMELPGDRAAAGKAAVAMEAFAEKGRGEDPLPPTV
jgi:hypothetical protein